MISEVVWAEFVIPVLRTKVTEVVKQIIRATGDLKDKYTEEIVSTLSCSTWLEYRLRTLYLDDVERILAPDSRDIRRMKLLCKWKGKFNSSNKIQTEEQKNQ